MVENRKNAGSAALQMQGTLLNQNQNADNRRGKSWKEERGDDGNGSRRKNCFFIGVSLRDHISVHRVEADNRLEVLQNTDDKGKEQHIHL